MSKKFYPNDGRPAIPFTSKEDLVKYMGNILNDFSTLEIEGNHVMTQKHGQYIKIGEVR